MIKKEEGFAGQISIVIPEYIREQILEMEFINSLFVTDIGYYPKAKYHYRERPNGAEENILIYSLKGKGIIELISNSYQLEENQFFIIQAGVPHLYQADANDPWSIYWIHYTGSRRDILKELTGRIITIAPSPVSRIDDRIRLFDEIIENLSLGYSHDNLIYSNICLLHLLGSFKYLNQFRKINYATEQDVVKKSILFMKSYIHKNMMLKEIASQFDLSASHFSRLFNQRTRHSPMDYFIHLKIQHACQLLDFTNLRVFEVSKEIGYDDPYYFSRIFKKVMGMSPAKYRKRSN